jgi:hypothetical protein
VCIFLAYFLPLVDRSPASSTPFGRWRQPGGQAHPSLRPRRLAVVRSALGSRTQFEECTFWLTQVLVKEFCYYTSQKDHRRPRCSKLSTAKIFGASRLKRPPLELSYFPTRCHSLALLRLRISVLHAFARYRHPPFHDGLTSQNVGVTRRGPQLHWSTSGEVRFRAGNVVFSHGSLLTCRCCRHYVKLVQISRQ